MQITIGRPLEIYSEGRNVVMLELYNIISESVFGNRLTGSHTTACDCGSKRGTTPQRRTNLC
jgi:hypothetical protein